MTLILENVKYKIIYKKKSFSVVPAWYAGLDGRTEGEPRDRVSHFEMRSQQKVQVEYFHSWLYENTIESTGWNKRQSLNVK